MSNMNQINKVLTQTAVVLLLAVLIPILLLTIFAEYRPTEETIGEWFQRSGSFIVALAVFAEFKLLKIAGNFNIAEGVAVFGEHTTRWQHRWYNILSVIIFITVFVGTLIWGYGDVPFKNS